MTRIDWDAWSEDEQPPKMSKIDLAVWGLILFAMFYFFLYHLILRWWWGWL